MPTSFNCLQCGKGCRGSAIGPSCCAQCGVELHISIESKAEPFSSVPKLPLAHPARSYPFQHSSGQSPWLIIVLILLVGVGVAWFLGKKGLLGGDEADHASSANASLMHLRKAMRLALQSGLVLRTARPHPGSERGTAAGTPKSGELRQSRGPACPTKRQPRKTASVSGLA